MKAKHWVILILVVLVLILLMQNAEVVSFKVFFWQISMSRIIAFPLLVLLGVVIGFVLGRYAAIGAGEKRRGGAS
ncbi:MAG: LapA family protein [bacterium]|nr:MAG: LapA family protein [bacterium]